MGGHPPERRGEMSKHVSNREAMRAFGKAERVMKMMKTVQRLFDRGHYDEAEKLARQAMKLADKIA